MLDAAPAILHLLVEIAETAEIDDETEAEHMQATLRDRGVRICIDDFGASRRPPGPCALSVSLG